MPDPNCPKCHGKGYVEYGHGLLQTECRCISPEPVPKKKRGWPLGKKRK